MFRMTVSRPVNLGTLYRICKCRAHYLSKQAE